MDQRVLKSLFLSVATAAFMACLSVRRVAIPSRFRNESQITAGKSQTSGGVESTSECIDT